LGYIKLDKKAFFHNLDYFSSVCSKEKLAIALKDNAYGHGIEQISLMCEEYGIKHVFVRDLSEAKVAKKHHFETILVLYDIPETKDDDIIVSINSLELLEKIPAHSKVELKVDTGMNRNGISPNQIEQACNAISEKNLILNGVFTHFCCSDEKNNNTRYQESRFLKAIAEVKKYISYGFRIHCANSAGTHKVDMSKYDLARVGIGAYGYLDIEEEECLLPVLSLHAKKIATKILKSGDSVGYGSKAYLAMGDCVVSNYDIGYGNGLFRCSEDKVGYISDGRQILGRVSMDSFSVFGTDSEVCVFNNVTSLANTHNTIKYEILTNLKANIKRVIV
jgi:alanine racemase